MLSLMVTLYLKEHVDEQKHVLVDKKNIEEVSPKNPHEDKSEKTTEDVEEIPQQKRKWAIPNEESNKWSQDVVEFYNNDDAPFCYSFFLKKIGSLMVIFGEHY
ncbi:hypothetical protein R6Q57_008480 [Mikania cordata]